MDLHELPYYKQLEVISSVLYENVHQFPYRGCKIASRLVHEITNLEQVVGAVILDEGFKPETHYWNYDKERELYVDLSLQQYNDRLLEEVEKITVVPVNYPWLRKSTSLSVDVANVRALVADVKQKLTLAEPRA